jgi:NAD(P)-dependent dehydrogenase (short-subunit alcohol dehydrogenase family)
MKKVILITGISSGFGKSTARLLAEKGYKVYGTIREEAGSAGLVNVLKMDLTDRGSIKNAIKTVIDKEGRIDILINNAGMHTGGPIETYRSEYLELQVITNFFGTVYVTREVLPVMRNQGNGVIINISSIGGLMGLPFQSFYSASKFAVEGFSEALRMEVRKYNIKVVVINPGDFCTNNTANRRRFIVPASPGDPYKEQFDRTLSIIEDDEKNGWNPVILAKKISKIINKKNPGHRYIIASFEQKLAVLLKYILPGKLFMKILSDHYKIN